MVEGAGLIAASSALIIELADLSGRAWLPLEAGALKAVVVVLSALESD